MVVASQSDQTRPEQTPHMVWIDELRGFAALAVALYHSMIVLWLGLRGIGGGHAKIGGFDRAMAVLSLPAHYGYAGVMLFFLLSGFVIHLPFAGGRRAFSFGPYIVRRFLRIYPPYAVALTLSLTIAILVPSAYKFQLHLTNMDAGQVLKSFFLVQNYPHAGGFGTELAGYQPASNLALWSLPVEMELYLAYPLLLLGMRHMSLARLSIVVAVISLGATLIDFFVSAPYGSTPNLGNFQPTFLHYWVLWAAGSWLAERLAAGTLPRWSWKTLTLLLFATVIGLLARTKLGLPRDLEDFVWGGVFFLVFLWLAQSGATQKLRIVEPLAAVGNFSYSLYLIHIPMFLLLAALWGTRHDALSGNFAYCIVAVVLVLPPAALMYFAVERPSIALGRTLSSRLARQLAQQTSAARR